MGRTETLGEFEQMVLLAVLHLGREAYGTTIRQVIEERTKRTIAIGALYTALERLERRGHVSSELSNPTPQRGGRAKRMFRVRPSGVSALKRSRDTLAQMWAGLNPDMEQSRG